MRDLIPPRTFSVTVAAVLAIITGFHWFAVSVAAMVWGSDRDVHSPGLRLKAILTIVILGCASVAALIGGCGILFRRNWGRILAIIAAGPLILFASWYLYPFVRFPALLISGGFIATIVVMFVLSLLAAIAWSVLLVGKKVRAEFLPPAMVQIYVNLLNEGTPCARPTQALTLGNGLFELLPTDGYDPELEDWELRPGSIVRGRKERRDGKVYLLATSFGR
jgi:hypothetical protein